MKQDVIDSLSTFLKENRTLFGFAPVERFRDAPEAHQPARVLKNAKTVVVFSLPVPRGLLASPDYGLYTLHRAYHSVYPRLNEIALSACNLIESNTQALAVPIPAYAPLVYHGMEPWGILSLKHAAAAAGLGAFGANGLVHHPTHGTLLRFGAVVTDMEAPGSPVMTENPCKEGCGACSKSCPSGALGPDRAFDKMKCLAHTIRHAIYPIALQDQKNWKHMETITNTAGYDYWLKCFECIKNCPKNQLQKSEMVIPAP